MKVFKSSNIFLWLRTLCIVLVSIAIYWVIVTNRSPNFLRPLSMLLRTGYTVVVPFLFCGLYLVFRLRGWVGTLFSLSLVLAIFALALAGVWAGVRTEAWLLSGVIPMFDATNYYIDALRLLAGQKFSEYSANKPLFPALFSVLLWVAKHNLITALLFLTLLVALGCWLLANEINKTHGPATTALVLLIVFIYYRIHSGVVRTENLGILFSVLGVAIIWRGIAKYQRVYYLAGIFITCLALIARPGPMFTLPAMVIWGAIFFRQKENRLSWKFLLSGGMAIFLAFFANMLVFWLLGARDSLPFGRFPYALYGLVSGGNSWAYVLEINPNATELEIYRMAFALFKEHPMLIFRGIQYNLSLFFSNTGYGLYSYLGGGGDLSSTFSYWLLLAFSIIGILGWVRDRSNPYLGFVITAAVGLIASVPFLPPTDAFRLRLYAGSVVILALLPALGLREILNCLKLSQRTPISSGSYVIKDGLSIFTSFILILVFLAPLTLIGIESPPEISDSYCNDGATSIIVRYDPGTMIHLFPQSVQFLDWASDIHIGTFRRNVHDFPSLDFMDWVLEEVEPYTTMFYTLDYRSYKNVLVAVESGTLPKPPAFLEVCGKWERDPDIEMFNIFTASSVILLEQ